VGVAVICARGASADSEVGAVAAVGSVFSFFLQPVIATTAISKTNGTSGTRLLNFRFNEVLLSKIAAENQAGIQAKTDKKLFSCKVQVVDFTRKLF
jgi:hypothetical protein